MIGLCAVGVTLAACTDGRDPQPMSAVGDEAVEIWAQPENVSPAVRRPLDFKQESRTVVWGLGEANAVLRYEPSQGGPQSFGLGDDPPVEVVRPVRLAVAENAGVFVYDDSTGMLDLYSPGGQHLRGFDPGLRPAVLEVAVRPLGVTFGIPALTSGSVPTLMVVQTDFRGFEADTLLSPDVGPESLRSTPAVGGQLVTAPAVGGLWVFAKAMSDTVFEVSAGDPPRKLVLPETDPLRAGILADVQQEILWVVAPRAAGGLEYEAFDVSGTGVDGVIDGVQAYLGVRTTPRAFMAQASHDGTVSGWWYSERGIYAPRGYDMRVEELRQTAEGARVIRDARRAATTEEWERAIQEAEAAELDPPDDLDEEDAEEPEESGEPITVE